MLKPHVAAFPVDFAQPQDLRSDAGDPAWIDSYINHQQSGDWQSRLRQHQALILVAYSNGSEVITRLSTQLNSIIAAVIYESPMPSRQKPGGRFPILQIWNLRSPNRKSGEAGRAYEAWLGEYPHRRVDVLFGNGRRTKPVWRPRTLFRGHCWDRSINPTIEKWLLQVQANPAVCSRQSA